MERLLNLFYCVILMIASHSFSMDNEMQIALEAQDTLQQLPPELILMITNQLSTAKSKNTAIKNILNFFQSHPQFAAFAKDAFINGEIIKKLAKQFYNNDLTSAAAALNTQGAKAWLKEYLALEKDIKKTETPFFEAVYKKNTRSALNILDASALDINSKNKTGKTALMIAAITDNAPLLKELIKRGANVNVIDKYGNTALYYAARSGNVELIMDLLKAGAEINRANAGGVSPLMVAIIKKHPTAAKALINNGADIFQTTNSGFTTLMQACYENMSDIVKILLPRMDVNATDKYGHTALIEATGAPESMAIVKELLAKGAKVNVTCTHMDTPLKNAVYAGQQPLVALLLKHGALINPPVGSLTPLMAAVSQDNVPMAEFLLSKGADISAVDANGASARDYVVSYDDNGNTAPSEQMIAVLDKAAQKK